MSSPTPCPDREKIFQLVHHLMEAEEEAETRRHVLRCEACLRAARDFEKCDALLDEWKVEGASAWFDQRLKQKVPARRPWAFRLFALPSTRIFAAALLVLVDHGRAGIAASLIIIGREIAISALREWMAREGKSKSVAVSFVGKLKTTSQMLSILLLLYHDPLLGLNCQFFGEWLLDIAAFLTLWSMLHYLYMAWLALKNQVAA